MNIYEECLQPHTVFRSAPQVLPYVRMTRSQRVYSLFEAQPQTTNHKPQTVHGTTLVVTRFVKSLLWHQCGISSCLPRVLKTAILRSNCPMERSSGLMKW